MDGFLSQSDNLTEPTKPEPNKILEKESFGWVADSLLTVSLIFLFIVFALRSACFKEKKVKTNYPYPSSIVIKIVRKWLRLKHNVA